MPILIQYIFSSLARIIRNVLYTPFVTFLILYIFFVCMAIFGLFLSNDYLLNLFERVLKFATFISGEYHFSFLIKETEVFLVKSIAVFAITYELLTKVISFFKKDFDHTTFRSKLLKAMKIFYGVTFVCSLTIFIFVFKEPIFSIVFTILLVANIITLGFAYKITNLFNSATSFFKKRDDVSEQKLLDN